MEQCGHTWGGEGHTGSTLLDSDDQSASATGEVQEVERWIVGKIPWKLWSKLLNVEARTESKGKID